MRRRDLVKGMAVAGLGALPGCRRGHITVPDVDPDIGRKVAPETIAVLVPIKHGQTDLLHERLEDHAFEVPSPGVHYARMLVWEDQLLLSSVFDSSLETLLVLLGKNAARVDAILSLTEDYPAGGAAARFELQGWLQHHALKTTLLYSAFDRAGEPAVREVVALRTDFLHFVRDLQRTPGKAHQLYDAFLSANEARIDNHADNEADQLTPAQLTDPKAQNPFTMVFDIKEDWVERLAKTFSSGQWFLDKLHIHPLRKIPTVHYARFANITRTKILFQSVYDGDWPQYVSDFAVNIPKQLDLVWGGSVDYPPGGAANAAGLGQWLAQKRLPRDYFYMANADRTVKEIQASLALGRRLVRFSKEVPTEGKALVRHVERFVHRNQTLLA